MPAIGASLRTSGLVLAAAGLLLAGQPQLPQRAARPAVSLPVIRPCRFLGWVAADMPSLARLTNYIRIYSSTGPASEILSAAQAAHLCVSLGIWLGRDAKANAAEIAAGIRLAKSSPAVRSVIVGNEVLLRRDLPLARLLADIGKVRAALGGRGRGLHRRYLRPVAGAPAAGLGGGLRDGAYLPVLADRRYRIGDQASPAGTTSRWSGSSQASRS